MSKHCDPQFGDCHKILSENGDEKLSILENTGMEKNICIKQ